MNAAASYREKTQWRVVLLAITVATMALAGCSDDDDSDNGPGAGGDSVASGTIEHFEVLSTASAYNGASIGEVGPYSLITGIVHGTLYPEHPDNAGIVDLDLAPKNEDGMVPYSTDVVILRPDDPATARRILFYDVVNRGRRIAQGRYIGGGDLADGPAPDGTFDSILQSGYTVVWSGWQGSVAQSGEGASSAIGTNFPIAVNEDGTSITGLSREEYVPDYAGVPDIPLSYPPASLTDRSEVVFTARQSWLNDAGQQDYAVPSSTVSDWDYTTDEDGNVSVQFTPPDTIPGPGGTSMAPDAGTIYSFVYRAQDPVVSGMGFAAVRDLVSFLRHASADEQGNPNPLSDLKDAPCASGTDCPSNPASNVDVAIGLGLSQSGRFLRDFLYQGFNKDAQGQKVFDGMMPIIPGSRRTWSNERFSQIGRWSKQHEDHWQPGDQFPFTYGVITDPVSGITDGLMNQCLDSTTCPRIMQLDGSYEWWGARASLVVTDGAGADIALPDNVRYYLVPGAQHAGGAGIGSGVVLQPDEGSRCLFATSPVAMAPVERALIPAMEEWVVNDTAPPPSRYPSVASGDLVPSDQFETGFPDLSDIAVPDGEDATPINLNFTYGGLVNQLFVTDYSNAEPVVDLSRQYAVLVPSVDTNGNETSGIRVPEVVAPLGSYLGYNIRSEGHANPEVCVSSGSTIPLAVSPATRAAGDPRASLEELYAGRTDYVQQVQAATDALVAERFLSAADAQNAYVVPAQTVSPNLLSAP